jgi:hypothetical protein
MIREFLRQRKYSSCAGRRHVEHFISSWLCHANSSLSKSEIRHGTVTLGSMITSSAMLALLFLIERVSKDLDSENNLCWLILPLEMC